MSLRLFITLAVVCATVLGCFAQQDYCQKAYNKCQFRFGFSARMKTFELKNDTTMPFTSRIRSKKFGQLIGIINANGITPEFVFSRTAFPITNFGDPYYMPTHFKPLSMGSGGSGIGHEAFRGDQYEYARFRCVRMFFSSFQILDSDGKVKRVENNVPFVRSKCAVFRTK